MYIVYIEAAVWGIRVLFIGSSGFDDTLGVYGPDIAIVILEILVSSAQIWVLRGLGGVAGLLDGT